jgi:hypothetical protein
MDLKYQSTTTLSRIRATGPCEDGWEKLLAHLGKTKADDEPLPLLTVLDSNGFDDALWVLSLAMTDDRLARHFQAWCAEQVLYLFEDDRPNDTRVRDQIAMLRNDDATGEERSAARAAARAAAWYSARAAAWSAARAAAGAAAGDAAGDAAWYSAGDAAWYSAGDAAWAAQEKQLRKMIGGV